MNAQRETSRLRVLRMGLVGGGGAGFIGKVHATAATLDRQAEVVAGALSSDPERAVAAGAEFGLDPNRVYSDWQTMLAVEQARTTDRLDFISVATPNATHFEIALAAVKAGFHVLCDKPMTINSMQADRLQRAAQETGRILAVTYNYSGYPMVQQAREMVRSGELGDLLAVRVSYVQGWLNLFQSSEPQARGAWKADPAIAGSGTLGDLGTHAWHLARFVTGFEPQSLCAILRAFHAERSLDDYGSITVRSATPALCSILISQMTHGRLNDLRLEVDGTQGSLSWQQERPNQLKFARQGHPLRIFERAPNLDYLSDPARAMARIPGGHPEGFLEAFAGVFNEVFRDIRHREMTGRPLDSLNYPTGVDGCEGVRFVEACLASHAGEGQWIDFSAAPDSDHGTA